MPAKQYRFWASCPQLPGELVRYIADPDRAQRVTYRTFARHADLSTLPGGRQHPALYRVSAPDNWAISFWRSQLPSGQRVYFFDWSRIEHVFVQSYPDVEAELAIMSGRSRVTAEQYLAAVRRRAPEVKHEHEGPDDLALTFPGGGLARVTVHWINVEDTDQPERSGNWPWVFISEVGVDYPGRGVGSTIMRALTGAADELGATMELVQQSEGPLSDEALCEWYQRFGFEGECGWQMDMWRWPASARAANPGYGPVRAGRIPTWVRPPKAAQKIAKSALKRREALPPSRRGGLGKKAASSAGITSGVERARSIARGDWQPAEDLRDFFARFRGTYEDAIAKDKPWEKSKVQQAWDLWGGDPMWRAAHAALEKEGKKAGPKPNPDYDPELVVTGSRTAARAMKHPAVVKQHEKTLRKRRKHAVAVLVPCAQHKPYRESSSHSYTYVPATDGKKVDVWVVSEPMGVIPYEWSDSYPNDAYEFAPKHVKGQVKDQLVERIRAWLERHGRKYKRVYLALPQHHMNLVCDAAADVSGLNLYDASIAACKETGFCPPNYDQVTTQAYRDYLRAAIR